MVTIWIRDSHVSWYVSAISYSMWHSLNETVKWIFPNLLYLRFRHSTTKEINPNKIVGAVKLWNKQCHNFIFLGALSSWMRYTGYYLSGHTRKEEVAVPTVEDCWEACLRETGFKCLSVAYAAVGSRSCRLYDKRALSVYNDWTRSTEFSYYEYCANGGLHGFITIMSGV